MTTDELSLYTAFTDTPTGGNPAGVWLGDEFPDEPTMLRIAADVGFSETVFAVSTGEGSEGSFDVRYFSPEAEVPFCGHATIALGARLARDVGPRRYLLKTGVGEVPLDTYYDDGLAEARLTSVEPSSDSANSELVSAALDLLDWSADELDPNLDPAVTYGGARHLLLAAGTRERLSRVDYAFDEMRLLMESNDLTTVNLVWRASKQLFHSRNLFPVGGVVEDPATGAAAAALGGHLRQLDPALAPIEIVIHQGDDLGRPSRIQVRIPTSGGIEVSGRAVPIAAP